MEDRYLPSSRTAVHVNTSGAVIVDTDNEAGTSAAAAEYGARDSRDIYLPAHTEWLSHVALDIGGSLAKVVYFSRSPASTSASSLNGKGKARDDGQNNDGSSEDYEENAASYFQPRSTQTPNLRTPTSSRPSSPGRLTPAPNGVLGPESLASVNGFRYGFTSSRKFSSTSRSQDRSSRPALTNGGGSRPARSNSLTSGTIPGGWLNFTKFETSDMESCINFVDQLVESSAASHNIPCTEFKAKHVKLMATGGGAHLFYDELAQRLGIEVRKEEEMECLIAGLTFCMEIPHEVFWYSDELVQEISHPQLAQEPITKPVINGNHDLPRPSPNPPQYSMAFDDYPAPQFPCMLVNIGSGVSIIKVTDFGQYERISGTSLGGGTLWGLLSMLTGAESFDEMLALSEKGDNSSVDMLVGDIYGSDYSKIGLKSSTIASSFGKVFRKGNKKKQFKPEDIAKSLLYAISNNIGQIAYMNAEKHNLDHIYFGGCFIRGHPATVSTLSYAIRFWSKGTKRALFLRHEGYLGAIGAWLRNIEEEDARL